MTLFRPEAINGQRRRLYGRVTIHQPAKFGIATGIFAGITFSALVYAGSVSFTKKQVAPGWVIPELGISEVFANDGAVIQSVSVKTGQIVTKGQVIALLSSDIYLKDGIFGDLSRRKVEQQIIELEGQIEQSQSRITFSSNETAQQINATNINLKNLQAIRFYKEKQLYLVKSELNKIAPLVEKGFTTRIDQDRREQSFLSLQQELIDIDRQIVESRSRIKSIIASEGDSKIKQKVEVSQLRTSIANLQSSLTDIEARRSSTVRAPVDGEIIAVNAVVGQTTRRAIPLVTIAPPGQLAAQILLETKDSGFIQTGQEVRLLVDAYPFERFGAISGRVERVEHSPITSGEILAPIDLKGAAYRVWVSMDSSTINAYGVAHKIKPGMTLKAHIITDKRTIFQWLFDPLLSAGRM